MPYTIDSPPDVIKGLPKPAQMIFIGAFNAIFDKVGQDEAKAFKIAWAAVGKKFKKDATGKWVALVQQSIKLDEDWDEILIEPVHEVQDLATYTDKVYELRVCDVAEVSFEGVAKEESNGRRYVWLKMMRPGWSFNGNYWTPSAASSMADHVMREGSRKLFVDHRFDADSKKYGRSMREWVATATESRVANGVPLVKVEVFTNNEPANDIWEKIQKYPDQVGTSVDARVKMKNGEAEGRKGHIVEEVVKLNSLDFVNEPSAGGGVVGIAASKIDDDTKQAIKDNFTESLLLLEQVATDLTTAMKNKEEKKKFWDLQSTLADVLRSIACADADEIPIADKKKTILTSLQQFVDEVSKLDVVAFESKVEKTNHPEEEQTMPYANLEELRTAQPELEKALREQIVNDLKVGDEAKENAAKLAKLETDNASLVAENKKVTDTIKEYKDKEVLATQKAGRDAMLAEAKIPDEFISEAFRNSIYDATSDANAAILIKDRQDIVEKASKKDTKPNFGTRKTEEVITKESKKSEFDPATYRSKVGLAEKK